MVFYRKKLQLIYKFLISQLFKIIYGKVFFSNKNDNDVKFTDINKGYFEQDCYIWDMNGNLVATSRQLAKILKSEEKISS